MKQYYYSVAVLPALGFEEEPFFSVDSFLEHCATFVSPDDLDYIRSASLFPKMTETDSGNDPQVLSIWSRFIADLQSHTARIRSDALGWDAEELPEPSGRDVSVADIARRITAETNPYRAELQLLRLQWDFLDDLELGHFFDREKLTVYYLRLQICLRRRTISDLETGKAVFSRQYDTVAQAMMEIV